MVSRREALLGSLAGVIGSQLKQRHRFKFTWVLSTIKDGKMVAQYVWSELPCWDTFQGKTDVPDEWKKFAYEPMMHALYKVLDADDLEPGSMPNCSFSTDGQTYHMIGHPQ